MVHPSQRNALYSARKPTWYLTFRRGDTTRNYRIRPVLAGSAICVFVVLLTAYVGATAYLICRDDLLGAAVSHQVKMQYAYEERISALRAELDRLTSRHAVQTEGVAQQLSTLLDQQATIEQRQSSLDNLVEQARASGLAVSEGAPRAPRARPDADRPATPNDGDDVPELGYQPEGPTDGDVISRTLLRPGRADKPISLNDGIRPVLASVGTSLDATEAKQSDALDALSAAAGSKAARISQALAAIGPQHGAGGDQDEAPEGGPYIPATGLHFVERVALLKRTLDGIDTLRQTAKAMPLATPVKALYLSSPFGYRVDPFLKRPAFHSGLDFVAEAGSTVYATAPGTVVSAGWNGGYGQMVEVQHAGSLSTRYGHLSEILVTPGTHVDAGTAIGRVGSTGRSTGPHLHYETRRDGEAVDPALYLAAGKALGNAVD